MSQIYTCAFAATAATAAVDFFEIVPGDDKICIIHEVRIGQTTELGDTAEEQLVWEIQRGGSAMTSGSGGVAAANGVSIDGLGPTSGFTFEAMNTTAATFTAGLTVVRDVFNVRSGLLYVPAPEDRVVVRQTNGGLTIRLAAAPADSVTWAGMVTIEEV